MRVIARILATAALCLSLSGVNPAFAAENYEGTPVVTNLELGADKFTVTITPATVRPLVFCPVTYSDIQACLGARAHFFTWQEAPISQYKLLQDSAVMSIASGTRQPTTLPAGSYRLWVANDVTRTQGQTPVFFGPIEVVVGPEPATTPELPNVVASSCKGNSIVPFAKSAKVVSSSASRAVSTFARGTCTYVVTGYVGTKAASANALALARASSVAALIKKTNPTAVVTVKNGGKAQNKSCAKQKNECVVVTRS